MQPPQDEQRLADEKFGGAVQRVRTEVRKVSQRAFADLLAERGLVLDASAISRIENGTRAVRLSEALVIADALGVELSVLVMGARTPEGELRSMRQYGDLTLARARDQTVEMLRNFQDMRDHLATHPELLRHAGDPLMGIPASSNSYLEWAGTFVQHLNEQADQRVHARDEESREALRLLACRFAISLVTGEPASESRIRELLGKFESRGG